MEMNKFRDALSGPVFIFFILLFIYAKWGPAIPFSTTTQSKGEPMMVSATGSVKVAPDSAVINFGIDESGQNLKQVQDSVNKKSQGLISEVKKLGIDEKDIKTISYNVYPESDYQSQTTKIIGYRVSINYQVNVMDFDKVNDLLTIVTQNGANMIGGVSFELSEKLKDEKLQEARVEASQKAKSNAQGLAKASGITLGKIINIVESQNEDYPRPYMMDKEIAITQPEIKAGETEIAVNITLSYEIR